MRGAVPPVPIRHHDVILNFSLAVLRFLLNEEYAASAEGMSDELEWICKEMVLAYTSRSTIGEFSCRDCREASNTSISVAGV